MKKIIFLILLACTTGNAQKELWGVFQGHTPGSPITDLGSSGTIIRFDINGENAAVKHLFDFTQGKSPSGKLLLASNGKIYGTTFSGGGTGTPPFNVVNGTGVLFEYDLVLDKFTVVHYFDYPNNLYTTLGVIEPIPGKLYGFNNNLLFCYDIINSTYTLFTSTGVAETTVYGELFKASNGFLYGTTHPTSPCPSTNSIGPYNGTIFKINISNNTVQTVLSRNEAILSIF